MDWHLIASWRDAGVPLNVALRGIDIAMDGYYARQTSRSVSKLSRINSLCYCHDAVMEAYAGYLESRVGQAPQTLEDAGTEAGEGNLPDQNKDEFGREAVSAYLSEKISEIESLLAKQYGCSSPENIERALMRLREIALEVKDGSKTDTEALERDLGIIDKLLCEELWTWVGAEERESWEQEAKKDKILRVYKKQLPKESYEKMRENFFRDKTRKKFHIGELSLFRL